MRSFDTYHLTNVDVSDKTQKSQLVWILTGFGLLVLLVITGFLLGRKYVGKLLAAGKI